VTFELIVPRPRISIFKDGSEISILDRNFDKKN
jgi:hypothetical protein